jgi:flagellar motor switch protein FliG
MPKPADKIPPLRKAALLMILLGEASTAEILQELNQDEVELLTHEIARVKSVTNEQAEKVLEEFHQMSLARDYAMRGGMDFAKKVLFKAFPPETAKKILDLLLRTIGDQKASFDALQKADPQQLAKYIHNEHPQTIALVLSHLGASQAAALLASLPTELRSDVALRMANLDQISPEVIERIATVIGQKLKNLGEYSRESYGGVRAVAEICNRLDSSTSREILDDIENQNKSMAETIRHLMFVFEDTLMIDPTGIREILTKVDRKVLTMALKGTSEQVRTHFTEGMSQRAREMLVEDMDALGPVKIKNVDAAQRQIIAVIRQLEADGVITLRGTVGEQFVL